MKAKLTLAGYQLAVYHHLLTIAAAREDDTGIQDLIEGPIDRLNDKVEHARANLLTTYDIEVSKPFWDLVKGNFRTNMDTETLSGRIEQSVADAIAAEIEKQFADQAAAVEVEKVDRM